MKKKKGLIIVAAISILAAGALSFYFLGSSTSAYVFETVKVEKGSVNITITATGTLEATNTVVVGTQVSGVVEKLYADFNSVVKKGQLIAELDKSTLILSLETAQADLNKAQAEFEYQESNLARMKALNEKNMLAQSDYDLAVYSYKLSKAGVKSAQANVDRSKRNLSYAMIYSPIDGVVLNRAVEEGQTVAASMNTPELFTIVNDLSTMQVEANVDEADIGMVKTGQRVEFTVDAFSDETFEGKVSEVRLQPTESSNVITYTVIVEVANPELKLKPGMTASISDYVEEANDVLILAGKATRFTPNPQLLHGYINQLTDKQPDNSSRKDERKTGLQHERKQELDDLHQRVWVKNGDNIHPVVIEVGIDDGSDIEVISGLEEGATIVTSFELAENSSLTKNDNSEDEQKSPFVQERPNRQGGGGPPR